MSKFIFCEREWGGTKAFILEGLIFSQQFCEYFSKNFEALFVKATGMKPSSKVTIAGYKQPNDLPFFQPGSVSKLNLVLWIMPEYNDNISFCWKSKAGLIIKPTDENFNEENLECWIEGLKPQEYWNEVATEKNEHPFQIARLPYSLKVFAFGVETELRIYFLDDINDIERLVVNTIQDFNDLSEQNDRKNGVVHNFSFSKENEFLRIRIDTGSAGIEIIKKILKSLTKVDEIKSIEVDI